jgi:hypothetical protein
MVYFQGTFHVSQATYTILKRVFEALKTAHIPKMLLGFCAVLIETVKQNVEDGPLHVQVHGPHTRPEIVPFEDNPQQQ